MNPRRILLSRSQASADSRRAERVSKVLALVEQFVYDLGLIIAGQPVDITQYVEPALAARLHEAVKPALDRGVRTRPDFGEYAVVRIEGDVLDVDAQVHVVVEFDDRSARLDDHGLAAVHARRRVRLQLLLDGLVSRVVDHRLELVA